MYGNMGDGIGFLLIMGIVGVVVSFFGAIYLIYYLFTHLSWV